MFRVRKQMVVCFKMKQVNQKIWTNILNRFWESKKNILAHLFQLFRSGNGFNGKNFGIRNKRASDQNTFHEDGHYDLTVVADAIHIQWFLYSLFPELN